MSSAEIINPHTGRPFQQRGGVPSGARSHQLEVDLAVGVAAASTPSSGATLLPGRGEWACFLVVRSGFHVKGPHVCVLSSVSPVSLYQGPTLSPGGPVIHREPGWPRTAWHSVSVPLSHENWFHRRGNQVQGLGNSLRGCVTTSMTVMVTEKASCSLLRPRDTLWDGEDGVSNTRLTFIGCLLCDTQGCT